MKKLFLVGVLALFGVMNAQSGNFKVGAHVGLPVNLGYKTNAGVDVAYMYPVANNLKIGVTTGYSHFFASKEPVLKVKILGSDISLDSYSFGIIPAAASVDYNVTRRFYLGADLGYAFFTSNKEISKTGGFYYQPKIGYNIASNHNIYLSYKGIGFKDEDKEYTSLSTINLGYSYTFGK